MKFLGMTIFLLMGLSLASGARADIYRWVDQDGVVHFSNYSPPDGAKVFLKEKDDTGQERSVGDGAATIDEVVAAARQEMERVLQEDRLREMNRKLDELLSRSQDAEARLAAAEASAAEAQDLAQEALAEGGNDNGPGVIYVAPPGYVEDYPLFFSDSFLGYGVRRFPGSFRSGHFVRPFIHDRSHKVFPEHAFGGHPSFKGRFDGLAHRGGFPTIPSMSHFDNKIRPTSHGFYSARGRW
jgi:hypothetical protein